MALPRTMRAVVCERVPIPAKGLTYTTSYPAPAPKAGHVLIRVRAFGLNRSELMTRQGLSPGLQFPRILGIECVGEVKDAGGSEKWKEGDVVAAIMGGMGRAFDGGYAEYTLIPQQNVTPPIKLPEGMTWAEFGALPETYLTAWGALSVALKLQPSDSLLVRGGTTSVGLASITLAKSRLFGAHKVIATTRSHEKVEKLLRAGADVVQMDEEGSVKEDVKEETDGKGVDKVIELVGGTTLMDSCQAMSAHGICAFTGMVGGKWSVDNFDPGMSLAPHKSLTLYTSGTLDASTAPLQQIVDEAAAGKIKILVDRVFKMEETGEAHEYMEANKAAGKVVCLVD